MKKDKTINYKEELIAIYEELLLADDYYGYSPDNAELAERVLKIDPKNKIAQKTLDDIEESNKKRALYRIQREKEKALLTKLTDEYIRLFTLEKEEHRNVSKIIDKYLSGEEPESLNILRLENTNKKYPHQDCILEWLDKNYKELKGTNTEFHHPDNYKLVGVGTSNCGIGLSILGKED